MVVWSSGGRRREGTRRWEPGGVRGKRGGKRNRSPSEESDGRYKQSIKCVVRFGDQIGVSKSNPLKLTKALNKGVGNIDFAKVLQDGNLRIGCTTDEQVAKTLRLKEVVGVRVVSTSRVGSGMAGSRGKRGIISGVPLNMDVEEIKNNLNGGTLIDVVRMKSSVNGAKKGY